MKTGAFKEYLIESWHSSNFEARYLDFPALLESFRDQFDAVGKAAHAVGFAQGADVIGAAMKNRFNPNKSSRK